jgi:hypothetical protein
VCVCGECIIDDVALATIALGVYEVSFARQKNRALILATVPVRLLFVEMEWMRGGAVVWEVVVVLVCVVALVR